jgi:DNA-binding CsgD family transcriptional regulator
VGVSKILAGRTPGTRVTRLSDRLVLVSVPIATELDAAESAALTKSERAVAALAASGLSNEAIARRRRCSARTVANQLASVYAKLGLKSRRELSSRFCA